MLQTVLKKNIDKNFNKFNYILKHYITNEPCD